MSKLTILIAFTTICNLNAQQLDSLSQIVISSSGEVFESNSYILSFTLGETVIETFEVSNGYLTQGFHQPDSVTLVPIIELNDFDDRVRVFPNPTHSLISFDFKFLRKEQIEVYLLDLQGKRLEKHVQMVKDGIIELDISKYPSGNYFIETFMSSSQQKHTYKIVKK